MTDLATAHDDMRPLMFSIAYRMLGSVVEAEDVVQEAFLRIHRRIAAGQDLNSPDAFATTVTTRLAIDALRSARLRREQYVGPWVPEPVVDSIDADPAFRVELDETVSLAFLTLMETLSPVERAVFILREVLGYEYAAVARIVEKSEANCRQLFSRAHKRLQEGRQRFEASGERRDMLARAFLDAVKVGDLAELERLLADDVVFYGDGGGRAPAIQQPMRGGRQVARFLAGLGRRATQLGVRVEFVHANGHPGARQIGPDQSLLGLLTLDIVDGRIQTVRNLINPDKLRHLGKVGDLTAVLRGEAQ